jgi:hypothetical protein
MDRADDEHGDRRTDQKRQQRQSDRSSPPPDLVRGGLERRSDPIAVGRAGIVQVDCRRHSHVQISYDRW